MDYAKISEALRAQLEQCAKEGTLPRYKPRIEEVWSLLDGNGELTLLVMLEYLMLRDEILGDVREPALLLAAG